MALGDWSTAITRMIADRCRCGWFRTRSNKNLAFYAGRCPRDAAVVVVGAVRHLVHKKCNHFQHRAKLHLDQIPVSSF